MTEEFKCPEFIIHTLGKISYQNTKSHPNWEKIKECIINNSLYK